MRFSRELSCLAPSGRFIELGTKDIFQNTRLGTSGFQERHLVPDCWSGDAQREAPLCPVQALKTLVRLFEDRRLHPLPHRVFPPARGEECLPIHGTGQSTSEGLFSRSRMIRSRLSRVCRKLTDAGKTPHTSITGGLGGFGLATAEWLAANGARHLVLVGRSGEITGNAAAAITGMEARGVPVVVSRADVTIDADVAPRDQ